MWRAFLVVALVGAVASVGRARADHETAGDAVVRQLTYITEKNFGAEWDDLHPLQQALVPRDLFIRCREAVADGIWFERVTVLDTYEVEHEIPGTSERALSTAVVVRYTVHIYSRSQTESETFHRFNVDGEWKWILDESVEAFARGRCP